MGDGCGRRDVLCVRGVDRLHAHDVQGARRIGVDPRRPSCGLARVRGAPLGRGHDRLVGLFQLTFFPALLVLGPLVAKEELGGAGAWGTILALQSVGAVLGGIYALRLKVRRPLVVCQLLVIPAGLVLAALAVPLPLLGIAGFSLAVGIGFALGNTLWMTTLQRNVPDHTLSRISSFDWFGSVALNPIGYALIGAIAATIGTSETLVIAAILNVAVCLSVVLVPSVRSIRMEAPATS